MTLGPGWGESSPGGLRGFRAEFQAHSPSLGRTAPLAPRPALGAGLALSLCPWAGRAPRARTADRLRRTAGRGRRQGYFTVLKIKAEIFFGIDGFLLLSVN